MKKYFNTLLIFFFVFLEIFILSKSKIVISNFSKTLNICLYNLLPTMFSSILISQILIKLNIDNYIPKIIINFFENIFNINEKEVVIFILSILSGYPNNVKMLNENNNLNNIIHYTNFVNPIFLIGTLKNIKLSIIILLSQYIGNIILGILLRKRNTKNNIIDRKENTSFLDIYYSSIKSTIFTISVVISNILFFSIINCLITSIIHINEPFNSIIIGLIEFSNGIYSISITNISIFYKGIIILFLITFASFSIHMQLISINSKIKYIKYLIYRIFNVLINLFIYIILFNIFFIH